MTVVGDDDQAICRCRRRLAEEHARLPARASTTRPSCGSSATTARARRILKAARAVVEPVPERIDKKLRGTRQRARCASGAAARSGRRRRRSRPRPSGSSRSRACRPSEVCVLVPSVQERGRGGRRGPRGARRCRSGWRLGGVLPARRGARRAGMAAAARRPGDSRRGRARALAAADRAAPGGRRAAHAARAPAQARHAVGVGGRARGAAALARRAATARRRSCGSTAPPSRRVRGPAPGPVRAAADRADRPAPPAGVRGPRRHRRAARATSRSCPSWRPPSCAASRRPPPRDFTRYLAAVAESGLPEEEAGAARGPPAVRVMTMHEAKGLEFDHVFVVGSVGHADARARGAAPRTTCPTSCSRRRCRQEASREAHEAEMRRLLHVAMTRARKGLVLAWAEQRGAGRDAAAVAVLRGGARGARGRGGGVRGGAVRAGRGTPLDVPDDARRAARHGGAQVGGRLGEMRLDTYLDVDQAVVALPGAAQGRGADRARARRARRSTRRCRG